MADKTSNIIEFTIVYNRFKGYLFNYVKKMVNNTIVAEDIIQGVVLKFYENIETIKNKEHCEFWLFKTARNDVYNYYRSRKVRREVYDNVEMETIETPENESVEYQYDQKEMHELIMKELNALPAEQRECFLLKEYSGLSYKEIAELLEVNEELVKSRLFKVRKKITEKITQVLFYGV